MFILTHMIGIGLAGGINTYLYALANTLKYFDFDGFRIYQFPGNNYTDVPPTGAGTGSVSGCQIPIWVGGSIVGWEPCEEPDAEEPDKKCPGGGCPGGSDDDDCDNGGDSSGAPSGESQGPSNENAPTASPPSNPMQLPDITKELCDAECMSDYLDLQDFLDERYFPADEKCRYNKKDRAGCMIGNLGLDLGGRWYNKKEKNKCLARCENN